MKVDLSSIPDSEVINQIVDLIKEKEKIKVKKEGKTIEVNDLSSRRLKFYTKKVLGKANLPGYFKVISNGDKFTVLFKEF
ncbi:MAG: hypothetical protein ACW964_07865 [Candidatus Hodarchaeales archaeon]|jgi:hypothetical protein